MSAPAAERPRRLSSIVWALAGVAAVAAIAAVAAVVLLSGGSRTHVGATGSRAASPAGQPLAGPVPAAPVTRPGPVAGSGSPGGAKAGAGKGAGTPASPGSAAVAGTGAAGSAVVAQAPDPEAAQSFPAPASVHHAAPTTPRAAGDAVVARGAPSDAEVRRELAQMDATLAAQRKQQAAQAAQAAQASRDAQAGGSIGGNGTWAPPPGVPAIVARVIAGGNAIATFPYRFGGGHASFVDDAYDCSASLSYALAAAGLVSAPLTSGELATSWGVPGPGRWITVMANAGHTYMYVAGMRFDTSFRSGVFGSRWQPAHRSDVGFVARHWPGL